MGVLPPDIQTGRRTSSGIRCLPEVLRKQQRMVTAIRCVQLSARCLQDTQLPRMAEIHRIQSRRNRKVMPAGICRLSAYRHLLLHPVPPTPATAGCNGTRTSQWCSTERWHSYRHQPQQRRSVDRTLLLQPERTSGRTTRWLLRERSELGLPYLQLGRNGKRRLFLVDEAFPQDVGILRCLPYRPHPGFLPHLGNPDACRTRTAGPVCSRPANDARRNRRLRNGIPRRFLHETLYPWILPRTNVRPAYWLCKADLHRAYGNMGNISHASRVRHTAQSRGLLCRKDGRRQHLDTRRTVRINQWRTVCARPWRPAQIPSAHRRTTRLHLPCPEWLGEGSIQSFVRSVLLSSPQRVLARTSHEEVAATDAIHPYAGMWWRPRHDPRLCSLGDERPAYP